MKLSAFTAIVLTAVAMQITGAAEFQPATLTAWNAHVKEADSDAQERASGLFSSGWMSLPIARLASTVRASMTRTAGME